MEGPGYKICGGGVKGSRGGSFGEVRNLWMVVEARRKSERVMTV